MKVMLAFIIVFNNDKLPLFGRFEQLFPTGATQRDGSWKLRNLIIENINLGEIYRGQFEAAALEAGGDLDVVIANWDDNRVKSLSEEE